jgi:ribosomal-protein-alanine N-acetyltransferase
MTSPKTLPILTTESLTLRQFSETDSEEIFELRSNPEINKYLERKQSKTLEDALSFIGNILDSSNTGELFYWALTKTGEEKLIGIICLFNFSENGKKCEIGFELLTEYHGKGIITEAANKVIEFANQKLGVNAIDASIHKDNQSSIRLVQKIGFKQLESVGDKNKDLTVFRLTLPG